MKNSSLSVIGGGVIGLGLAGELADYFGEVTLIERNSYNFREASYAAGGMLSPFMEVEFNETELLQLSKRSLEKYESFITKLRNESGVPLKLRSEGSLFVALDEVQLSKLNRLYDYQKRLGLPTRKLSANEVTELEPSVSENVQSGLFAPQEKHINNRQLGLALLKQCQNKDVTILTDSPVNKLNYSKDKSSIKSIETPHQRIESDVVIVAAGVWSNRLPGLKLQDKMPIRPVKGQALSVQFGTSFQPQCIVRSSDFYGVPHFPERFIIGATMEEKGFNSENQAGKILDLLDAASHILPEIKSQNLLEFWSGLRPASIDSRPIIGPSSVTKNLYFATGHFRNGILLLPVTIEAIKQYLLTSNPSKNFKPFLPVRFQDSTQSEEHLSSNEKVYSNA